MILNTVMLPFEVLILYTFPFIYYQIFTFLRSLRFANVDALKSNKLSELKELAIDPPLISILIPTKGEDKDLIVNLVSRLNSSKGSEAFEIIIISDDPEDYVKELEKLLSPYRNVIVLRRERPKGFKACALQYGFERSRGEYVITLDVDSIIDPGDIIKAAKYLEVSGCDAVTFRWMGYTNSYSYTAIGNIISTNTGSRTLFLGRSGWKFSTFPVGSGTMFKADSLRRVGGWNCEVVQDDLDIGARMIASGMKICPLSLPIYVEVPSTLRSFMIQQSRWALGTAETLRSNALKILKANISLLNKIDAIWYLLQYTPIISTLIAMLYLIITVLISPSVSPPLWLFLLWMTTLGVYGSTLFVEAKNLEYPTSVKVRSLGRVSALYAGISFYILMGFINGMIGRKVYRITPKGRRSSGSKFVPIAPLVIGIVALISSIRALISLNFVPSIWIAYYSAAMLYTVYVALREG